MLETDSRMIFARGEDQPQQRAVPNRHRRGQQLGVSTSGRVKRIIKTYSTIGVDYYRRFYRGRFHLSSDQPFFSD